MSFDFKKYVKNISESYRKQVWNKSEFEEKLQTLNESSCSNKGIKENDEPGEIHGGNFQYSLTSRS